MPHLPIPSPCEIREMWIISPFFDSLGAGVIIFISWSVYFYFMDNLSANSMDFVLLYFSEPDFPSANVRQ